MGLPCPALEVLSPAFIVEVVTAAATERCEVVMVLPVSTKLTLDRKGLSLSSLAARRTSYRVTYLFIAHVTGGTNHIGLGAPDQGLRGRDQPNKDIIFTSSY